MTATEPTQDGVPFMAVLCVEGYQTPDGRYLEPGMGSWRQLPQPLMFQTINADGHAGAEIAARIDTIRMDGRRMVAEGVFDNSTAGNEYARLVHDQMIRFVSIDVADAEVTLEPIAFDDDGYPTDMLARFGPYQIMGATATAHPAIDLAVIWLKSDPAPEEYFASLPDPLGAPCPMPDMPLMASMQAVEPIEPTLALLASGEVRPPAAWFADPNLSDLTPLTVTDEGRVFGHVAPWGCCHIGFMNRCVEPPRGGDYSLFLVGEIITREGTHVPTGTMTAFGGHADENLSAQGARAHHDDVSMACADVTCGEDDFGLWVAGSVRPGVTDEQLRVMRASAPSGDWRPIRGRLELLNIHYVNTPGFPVPRLRARVASGDLVGLTASIGHAPDEFTATDVELEAAEIVVQESDSAVEPAPPENPAPAPAPDPLHIPDGPAVTIEERLAAIETAISPVLELQRDEILARHPAPPEPSPLEQYLQARGQ